jgi:hypothetical protein
LLHLARAAASPTVSQTGVSAGIVTAAECTVVVSAMIVTP